MIELVPPLRLGEWRGCAREEQKESDPGELEVISHSVPHEFD